MTFDMNICEGFYEGASVCKQQSHGISTGLVS